MPQAPPTGEDIPGPDPRAVRDRVDLAAALLSLKARSNLSYRRLERVTAEAPGARFGLPFTTIRDYVQGRSLPTPDRLDQIVWACRVTDPEARAEWARALRRAVETGAPSRSANPYLGAAPYTEADADRFHGRSRLVADLLNRLPAATGGGGGLQAVVGASGAGTTSVLRAGLVAALRRADPARPVHYGTPGPTDPAGQLAELLGAARKSGPTPVVVLDQLEQVLAAPAPVRSAFLTMLEEAATSVVVVVGLRADALERARRQPVLAAALDGGELLVDPLTVDELRAAIVAPAVDAGRAVGDALVELLVHELRAGRGGTQDIQDATAAGVLPLVSTALAATWAAAQGDELTVADYRAGGGLDGAAARAAEATFAALTAEQQRIARSVLLRLVRFVDGEPVGRRATAAELAEPDRAGEVVGRLVDGRVLTTTAGTVEISCEALLHAWPRLAGWLAEDPAGHAARGAVVEAARRWQDGDGDRDLLLRGARLAAALDWAVGAAGDELTPGELGYLRAGVERDAAEHAVDRAGVRRLRMAVAVLAVLTAALVGVTASVYATRPGSSRVECPAPPPTAPTTVPTTAPTTAPTDGSVVPPA